MMVRVYKDVYVDYKEKYDWIKEVAIDVALDCLSDFDIEILEEDNECR